jgi:2,4-dienoyl-CoA reductase-like NADH-dependent reductase (Old Yellow Enzyme family)
LKSPTTATTKSRSTRSPGVDRHFRIAREAPARPPRSPHGRHRLDSWLQIYSLHAAAHNIANGDIRIFGMGRNALAYPDFAVDALAKGGTRRDPRLQNAHLLHLPHAAEESSSRPVPERLPAL